MNRDDEFASYGDPETDPDAALLDHELRQLLNDIPDAGAALPPEATAEISGAVAMAWPDGHPPAPDVVAGDQFGDELPGLTISDFDPHHSDSLHGDHFGGHDHAHDDHHTDHGDYGHHGLS